MCHIPKGAPTSVMSSPTPTLNRTACEVVSVDGVVDDDDPAQPRLAGRQGEPFAQTLRCGQVVPGPDHAVVHVVQAPHGAFGDRVRSAHQLGDVAPCRARHREDERGGEENPQRAALR